MTPTLLNEIELTVELWQENGLKASSLACNLECRFLIIEIWLVVEHAPLATSCCTLLALEAFA